MSSFAQIHPRVTTYHLLDDQVGLIRQLVRAAAWRKPVLLVPTVATEFSDPANRPVFENTVKELSGAGYLGHIIFGLDQAEEAEVRLCKDILQKHGMHNYVIQWNDGPSISAIYRKMQDRGFDLATRCRGRNLFMGFGAAMALGASSVGMIDADIRTFRRRQLDRLFFPVLVNGYPYSKAFYARWDGQKLYGRVKRLLLDPLLMSLKKKLGPCDGTGLVDFLLAFGYQLSSEMVMETGLLKKMHYSLDWGVEVFNLIEVWRKAPRVAQVEFTRHCYDHRHQRVCPDQPDEGLSRMSKEVMATLFQALVCHQGLAADEVFYSGLAQTYEATCLESIAKYAENAAFNQLSYDRGLEERLARDLLAPAIAGAADLAGSPANIGEKMLRLSSSSPELQPFMAQGLGKAIAAAEENQRARASKPGQLPSWERILWDLPELMTSLVDALEEDKQRFRSA